MASVKDFINENLEDTELTEAKITKAEVIAYGNKSANSTGPKVSKMSDVGKRVKGFSNASELAGWYHEMLAAQKSLQATVAAASKIKEDDTAGIKAAFNAIKAAEKEAVKYVNQINSVEAKIVAGEKKAELQNRVAGNKVAKKEAGVAKKTVKKAEGKAKTDAFKENVKKKVEKAKISVKKAGKDAVNPAKNFMAQFKKS